MAALYGNRFFGFGSFTTAPLAAGLVADLFGNRRMGTLIGVTNSSHMLGSALGAFMGGFIYELTGSYYWMFVMQGALEFMAVGLAFMIKKKKPAG